MAKKLGPASGTIGEAGQGCIERFGEGDLGAEGIQVRFVEVLSFLKRGGQHDRFGQRAPRFTIQLENDPPGSATRGKACYPRHETSGS